MKCNNIVGHVPLKISSICSSRWYSADLPQGGLEILCTLVFEGKLKKSAKLTNLSGDLFQFKMPPSQEQILLLLSLVLLLLLLNLVTILVLALFLPRLLTTLVLGCMKDQIHLCEVAIEPPEKKRCTDCNELTTVIDTILKGEKLTDIHIHLAQQLLKKQFPNLNGLRSTVLCKKKKNGMVQKTLHNKVQIIHCHGDH